jgi:hypothetical protein
VKGVADEEVQAILARPGAVLAVFEIEEIKATLGEVQKRFAGLLARRRGSEGAGT